MTVAKLFNLCGHLQEVTVLPIHQTLYQSLPELRSSERVILEPWLRQTVLQVPMMKENMLGGGPSLSEDEDRGELVCTGLIII